MNRLIPIIQIFEKKVVKTTNFKNEVYIGDPVNIVQQFHDLGADEIVIIDIARSRKQEPFDLGYLERIAQNCFLPLTFGGGVRTALEGLAIIQTGFERILINTLVHSNPAEVKALSEIIGSQAILGGIDYRYESGQFSHYNKSGSFKTNLSLTQCVSKLEAAGIGEIILTNIDKEGTRCGLDNATADEVLQLTRLPLIINGGASSSEEMLDIIKNKSFSAAAGSIFSMYKSPQNVLVSYPFKERHALTRTPLKAKQGHSALEESSFKSKFKKRCTRCIITIEVPNTNLENNDTCSYCSLHDDLELQYPINIDAETKFASELDRIRSPLKKYDCIIGLSGGTDSSYLAHFLVESGIRPLAVHFDNTWNTGLASQNIFQVVRKLNLDLITFVVDNCEYDDIYKSFLLAGVPDIEAPTDIGFMSILYKEAEKNRIPIIVEGHSFRTEGVSPLGWLYMDGKYIESVHAKFGSLPLRTYPNMKLFNFLKWSALSKIERFRPLYWIDYNKKSAIEFLIENFNWRWYGGHHLENRFTSFYHTYLLPFRFGIDFRNIEFSALIRSGQKGREESIQETEAFRERNVRLKEVVRLRLGFTHEEFDQIMNQQKRSYRDFRTYKRVFELMRPIFYVLVKLNRVPLSFYVKFCKKHI
jgi:imidazoleglycerol phosphate synthase cyclase subunit